MLLATLAALAGCSAAAPVDSGRTHSGRSGEATVSESFYVSPGAPIVHASAAAPASMAPTWAPLEVEGFLPSVVVVPPDDGRMRPLLIATHGAGGTPEAHCERWLSLVGTRAFILCTRGRETDRFLPPDQRGYFYDGHIELGKEVVRAVAALDVGYKGRVDSKGAVFAGYSQGASMGALFIHERREHAAMFSRIILVEGGAKEWTVAAAERLHDVGARVAIFCGQAFCDASARSSLKWMQRSGLDARTFYAPGAGHTYGGDVGTQVEAARRWLFAGDPRWLPGFD